MIKEEEAGYEKTSRLWGLGVEVVGNVARAKTTWSAKALMYPKTLVFCRVRIQGYLDP